MTNTVVAGLDVGKDEVHGHANGSGRTYANVSAGFRGLRIGRRNRASTWRRHAPPCITRI